MKKLKLRALELGSAEVLSRAQLKHVLVGVVGGTTPGDDGGGATSGCCCTHSGNSNWTCGKSMAGAQADAKLAGINWCCDSCTSLGAPAPCEG